MPTNSKSKKRKKRTWDEIAREAQEYRDASIDRVRPSLPQLPSPLSKNVMGVPETVLNPCEIKITQTPPEDLVVLLASGGVTAKAVVNAFLRRAVVAQKLVRTLTLMFPHSVLYFLSTILTSRPTASRSSSRKEPSHAQSSSTSSTPNIRDPLVRCTAFP